MQFRNIKISSRLRYGNVHINARFNFISSKFFFINSFSFTVYREMRLMLHHKWKVEAKIQCFSFDSIRTNFMRTLLIEIVMHVCLYMNMNFNFSYLGIITILHLIVEHIEVGFRHRLFLAVRDGGDVWIIWFFRVPQGEEIPGLHKRSDELRVA